LNNKRWPTFCCYPLNSTPSDSYTTIHNHDSAASPATWLATAPMAVTAPAPAPAPAPVAAGAAVVAGMAAVAAVVAATATG